MKFREITLSECLELIIDYRGKTPKKLGGDWSKEGEYKAISAKNIKENKVVNQESIKTVNKEIYKKWMKTEVQKGDILLTSEAPLGELLYWDSEEKIVLSQRLFGLRPNSEVVDPKYLFAFMNSVFYQKELDARSSGTTVVGIRQAELLKTKLLIPDMEIQRFIGETLFEINTKININETIINKTEILAQLLFKHWFIDFEFPNEQGQPYKSSGGKMVESKLGMIPEKWDIKAISDIADIMSGGTPKTQIEEYWNGSIPFFTPKDVKGSYYTLSTEKYITDTGLAKCASKLYPKDTIFITARGTVGKIALAASDMAMNQSCYALKHIDSYQYYLYLQLKQLMRSIIQSSNGAVFNAINVRDFSQYKTPYGSNDILEEFEKAVKPLFEMILSLSKENNKLTNLRDTLLPKLLSGEIVIPLEAESALS